MLTQQHLKKCPHNLHTFDNSYHFPAKTWGQAGNAPSILFTTLAKLVLCSVAIVLVKLLKRKC